MKSLLYAFLVVFAILAIPSFAVVTTDDDDYDEDEDTVAVDSTALQASLLEMPNAFSPNGDGINDTYHVKKYQNITEFRALIFNRWGQCLYTWNEIDGSWDGTYKGRPVKDGVYFVRVRAKGGDGKEYDIKKDVNLLRKFNQVSDTNYEQ
jgi:gliding motility-associated-like protein